MVEWQKLKIGYGSPPSSLLCLLGQVETSVFGVIGHHIGALFPVLELPAAAPNATPAATSGPSPSPSPSVSCSPKSTDLSAGSVFRWLYMVLWISQFRLVPSTSIPRGSPILLIMGPRVHNLWCYYSGGNGHSVTGKVCRLGPVYGCTQPRSHRESDYG